MTDNSRGDHDFYGCHGRTEGSEQARRPVEGTDVESVIGFDYHQQLLDEIELLDGAADAV